MVVVPVAWASLLRRHHSCFSDLRDNPVSCSSNCAQTLSHSLRKVPGGVRNPAPSWHTCLSAWDPQNPWVNLLSAGCPPSPSSTTATPRSLTCGPTGWSSGRSSPTACSPTTGWPTRRSSTTCGMATSSPAPRTAPWNCTVSCVCVGARCLQIDPVSAASTESWNACVSGRRAVGVSEVQDGQREISSLFSDSGSQRSATPEPPGDPDSKE